MSNGSAMLALYEALDQQTGVESPASHVALDGQAIITSTLLHWVMAVAPGLQIAPTTV